MGHHSRLEAVALHTPGLVGDHHTGRAAAVLVEGSRTDRAEADCIDLGEAGRRAVHKEAVGPVEDLKGHRMEHFGVDMVILPADRSLAGSLDSSVAGSLAAEADTGSLFQVSLSTRNSLDAGLAEGNKVVLRYLRDC